MIEKHVIKQVYDKLFTDSPSPLSPLGALAALLVVEGALSLEDAANAVRIDPEMLVEEAQAWAIGAIINGNDQN